MEIIFKKGQTHQLKIEDLAFGGKGITKINGFVIFTEGAIPGDEVEALITKKKSSFAEARVKSYIKRGPAYIKPRCSHFDYCGGCKWQDLNYSDQLLYKQNQVINSIHRIADVSEFHIEPIIPAKPIFAYRNKMEFTFSNKRFITREEFDDESIDRSYALGLHVPRIFDKVLPIQHCYIQDELFNGILNTVNEFVKKSDLPIYDLKSHEGIWRFLMLRKGQHSNEYMVNFVTSTAIKKELMPLVKTLTSQYPQIKSIVNNLTRRMSQTAIGEEEVLLYGKSTITDKLGDFSFDISSNSFFQTNTIQAEKMYECIKSYIDLKGDEVVLDLYCGTGTIPIYISEQAKEVHGFELVESSVENAKSNCKKLSILNCYFYLGDVRYVLPNYKHLNPDVIIVDPPRAGLHPDVVENVMDLAADTLLYVSCNPATLARDLKLI